MINLHTEWCCSMVQNYKLEKPNPVKLEEVESEMLKNFIRLKKVDNKWKTFSNIIWNFPHILKD